jgi:hypothetical protein
MSAWAFCLLGNQKVGVRASSPRQQCRIAPFFWSRRLRRRWPGVSAALSRRRPARRRPGRSRGTRQINRLNCHATLMSALGHAFACQIGWPSCAWAWRIRRGRCRPPPRPGRAAGRRTGAGNQRGAGTIVAHPGHEFARVGARVGDELIAGVPKVVEVEMDAGQPGRLEGGQPDAAAEIRVR